jgi:hypothetical protein
MKQDWGKATRRSLVGTHQKHHMHPARGVMRMVAETLDPQHLDASLPLTLTLRVHTLQMLAGVGAAADRLQRPTAAVSL